MFDTQTSVLTSGMAWISILLYSFALIYTLSTFKRWPGIVNNKVLNLFWMLFFTLFAVTYAIDSDFFHYKDMVYSTKEVLDYGLEKVYQHIILFVSNNYLFFRIIVFGGAVLVYYFCMGSYKTDKRVGILLMIIIFGGIFSYARATLAFSIYYLGLSFVITQRKYRDGIIVGFFNKTIWIVVGIGLILSSFFFHRSMLLLIILTPLAFLNLGKKSIFAIILLSPIVLFALNSLLGDFLSILSFDEVIDSRLSLYSEARIVEANWKGVLGIILHYGKYLLCLFIISPVVFKHYSEISTTMRRLFSFYIVLTYVAVICFPLFDGNIIFMHRFLKMSIIPIILIITYLYKNKFLPYKYLKWIVYISAFTFYSGTIRYILL